MPVRFFASAFLLAVVAVAVPAQKSTELRFARIFTDHMVLQQQKKARVWGFANPGSKVVVTITEDGAFAQPFLPEEKSRASVE